MSTRRIQSTHLLSGHVEGADATAAVSHFIGSVSTSHESITKSAQQPKALSLNASEALVSTTLPASTTPVRAGNIASALSVIPAIVQEELVSKSITDLHQMALQERDVLADISRAGQEVIRKRLLVIFAEIAKRYEAGEKFKQFTGKRAMGAYLRSIKFDPGKLRVWKFQVRKEETAALVGTVAPPPKRSKKKAKVIIKSKTEAKAGVRNADVLPGNSIVPPTEWLKKAKALLEATADVQYDRDGHLPAPAYLEKGTAADAFRNLLAGSAFQQLLSMLDSPDLANSHDLEQLANVLIGASDCFKLMASVIKAVLTGQLRHLEPVAGQNAGPVKSSEERVKHETFSPAETPRPQQARAIREAPKPPAAIPPVERSFNTKAPRKRRTPAKVPPASTSEAAGGQDGTDGAAKRADALVDSAFRKYGWPKDDDPIVTPG